ncbi:MAG: hypothetical protein GY718_11060 [Lentisphaerae bacterium]|nr:hypothetical protein [Lentisphaerota bacterium]
MKKKKASDFFHKEDSLNCAQAILKFFEDNETVSSELITEYKAFGGGRAPRQVCGALYGTMHLLQCPEKIKEAEKFFLEQAGAIECEAIKAAGKVSCAKCVDLAAEFVCKKK